MSAEEPRRRKLTITHPARDDLRDIHAYTVERHGTRGAEVYDGLLKQAIRDVWEDPHRPGSRDRPEIGDGIRSYHTRLSRNRAGGEIRAPRHFVLYFLPTEDEVVVSRVLHDSRDLARHVPDDHLDQATSNRSSSARGEKGRRR